MVLLSIFNIFIYFFIVSLTKTSAKGRTLKTKLIEVLRNYIDEYGQIFLFSYNNMRTSSFRKIRMDFKQCKLFLGKNSISQIALGRSVEEEYLDNLSHLSKMLDGKIGILFTKKDKTEVENYFNSFSSEEFALMGDVPEDDILLQPGELELPTTMRENLRKLGLVVETDDGKLILREPHYLAKKGQPLTAEQAKLLVKFDMRLSLFTVKLLCRWQDGSIEEY